MPSNPKYLVTPAPIIITTIAAWKSKIAHFFCWTILNLKILTKIVMQKSKSNNSNHQDLKITF